MDSKRKANLSSEAEDRSSKRRKVADIDLSKGETAETTIVYGHAFLEQIRRTADKSGRLVATYFEKLLPRESNKDYYKRTRMPISLETIEEKLDNGDFSSLAELESYFKRMISNAKDFYPRSSQVFDDAERVRKALSNYMTKTNPAYSTRGYQAVPTPLPPESNEEEDEEEEGDEDAEGEEENEEVAEDDEADADGEEDENEGDEQEDAEEEEDEAEEEEEQEPRSRRKSIIIKRRGPARSSKANAPARPDHEYENVPYKGLSFQQAQEKIVEELIRYQEPEYDDAYFDPFINLPPRALRDYYKIITDPLSLKKLQKSVKGVHGRHDPTGISEFKTWGAFEEKSKLLWENAYFYNEEGSEIYGLAQELEKMFKSHLKKAQAAVSEPAQPKIKLKVGQQATETPTASKKITIHVGGRDSSINSPAPQASTPVEAATTNGHGAAPTPAKSANDAARSASISVPSPTPSAPAPVKAEDSAGASPAVVANGTPNGTPAQAMATVAKPPIPPIPSQPFQTNPLAHGYVDQRRFRAPGKGIESALISKLRIQTHPVVQADHPTMLTVLPSDKEMQQSAMINLPPNTSRIWIVTTLPTFLQDRQYSMWALINKQPLKQCAHPIPNQTSQDRVFDVLLLPGLNIIEAHLIAAIPRSEREQGGPEVELEVFTVLVNVGRF